MPDFVGFRAGRVSTSTIGAVMRAVLAGLKPGCYRAHNKHFLAVSVRDRRPKANDTRKGVFISLLVNLFVS